VQRLNRYYRRSIIVKATFRLLARHFALVLHAADAAQSNGISHRPAGTIFGKIRQRIAEECERQSPFKGGEVEVDESHVDPHRVRGRRGLAGAGVRPSSSACSSAMAVSIRRPSRTAKRLLYKAIIRGRVSADVAIHSDGWRGYDGLADVGLAVLLPYH
jgi:transposase